MADEAKKAKRSDLTCLLWVLGSFAALGAGVLVLLISIAWNESRTFNCRAKQAEAKTNLAGLFTAEKFFRGEYESHSTDLVAVNWHPDGSPLYLYGFAAPSSEQEAELRAAIPGYDPNRASTDHPDVVGVPPRYAVTRMSGLVRSLLPPDAVLTEKGYTAAAVGNIDDDATLDVWTIDDARKLTHLVNDCQQ